MTSWKQLFEHPRYTTTVEGISIVVHNGVFTPDPKITHSSTLLLRSLPERLTGSVLDMGCGTGIGGIFCLKNGATSITFVDISKEATENTKENLQLHHLKGKVLMSSLFEDIEEQFDTILANLPILEEAWINLSASSVVEQFLTDAHKYLKPGGKVYMTWASFGDLEHLQDLIERTGYAYTVSSEEKLGITWYVIALRLLP
ncbi:hypothetical protein COW46_03400 [Candidatus Gracilibacteria bacterium CG17_big_fil_post_rev_8_21_14_2_50_48_13]|nr:MAG: hypothetical protein COW46_03400 [Candidatus Gracilibacteria bacterium CG17_big_fil_post_rev_8_21_14_2_50_48_13]